MVLRTGDFETAGMLSLSISSSDRKEGLADMKHEDGEMSEEVDLQEEEEEFECGTRHSRDPGRYLYRNI